MNQCNSWGLAKEIYFISVYTHVVSFPYKIFSLCCYHKIWRLVRADNAPPTDTHIIPILIDNNV